MRQLGSIKSNELVTVEAPTIIQKAINRLDQSIASNAFNDHDYRTMIINYIHLNPQQQDEMLTLFSNYSTLFDRTLGKIPTLKFILISSQETNPSVLKLTESPTILQT